MSHSAAWKWVLAAQMSKGTQVHTAAHPWNNIPGQNSSHKGIYDKGKETSGPPDSWGEQEREVPLELSNCLNLVHLLNNRTWFPKCNISLVILSFYQFSALSHFVKKEKIISMEHF